MTFTKLAWISIPLAFWACTDSTSSGTSWNSATHITNEGDYGTVIKSFALGVGDTARITLEEGTALQITDGACVLIAD